MLTIINDAYESDILSLDRPTAALNLNKSVSAGVRSHLRAPAAAYRTQRPDSKSTIIRDRMSTFTGVCKAYGKCL